MAQRIYTNSSEISIICGISQRWARELLNKAMIITGLEKLTLRDVQEALKWSTNY